MRAQRLPHRSKIYQSFEMSTEGKPTLYRDVARWGPRKFTNGILPKGINCNDLQDVEETKLGQVDICLTLLRSLRSLFPALVTTGTHEQNDKNSWITATGDYPATWPKQIYNKNLYFPKLCSRFIWLTPCYALADTACSKELPNMKSFHTLIILDQILV